jgi:hypothetical protein
MQVNSAVMGYESGCPQGINSDPAWSSFSQRRSSSSSGCIDQPPASLWVPFYRIILDFNLQTHRWGFVQFFIQNLPILARSASFRTNSYSFSFHHQLINLDLDLVGFHYHSRFQVYLSADVMISWFARSFYTYLQFGYFRACRSCFTVLVDWHVLMKIHQFSSRSINIFHCQSTGQIGRHASLQTGESRVSRAWVLSYFHVNIWPYPHGPWR